MGHIFLSYAREDRAFAQRLAHALEQAGHEVWWDQHLDSGEEFSTEIETALAHADIVLVAWSMISVKSRWVRDEAAVGGDSDRLVPVSIDGTLPPMGFRQFHTMDLTGWKGGSRDQRTGELLHSVDRRLKGKAATPEPPAAPTERRFSRRWRLLAAAAALVLIIAASVALLVVRSERMLAEPASLAVLPFKNMSAGDPYFAEGVAEEISDQLSREPQFRVTGRTSAGLFKDAADLSDVGRRLHVAYVLEGSVRSAGQQVRVDVSLVDTKQGVRLWSQNFRGSLNDIFAIQDSIGQQVAAHVRRQLIPSIQPSAMKTSGDVYSLYVTARSLMRQREPGKLDAAVDLLKRAVKADPNYAPVWARLALAEQLYGFYADQDQSAASRAEHIRYAEHAIALAPKLADAHAILGLFLSDSLNAQETRRARQELETAVRLDAGNAEAWYWLATLRLGNLEFAAALDALRRTATIDPFFVNSRQFPELAWEMGHRDEAVRFLDNRIANNPDPFMREMARSQLALLRYDLAGAYEDAKSALGVAQPDVKQAAEGPMASVLLQLGLFDNAERFVPKPIVDMFRGKLTFPKGFRQEFPDAAGFWLFSAGEDHRLPRVLVKTGKSRELVGLYDEAFSSPADMASRYPRSGFVLTAPVLAIALQQVGRGHEGARIIVTADAMCRKSLGVAPTPVSFRVMCSRVEALAGRPEEAIRVLEQAVADGWRPSEGEYAAVTDEPAYASLRTDPRMKHIDAVIAADIARERRELVRVGI